MKELRTARIGNGLSQTDLARLMHVSQSALARLEAEQMADIGVVRLSEYASVVGLKLSVSLYPVGDAVRDRAQLAIGRRLNALLSPRWRVTDETLLPGRGELRAWDKTLRLAGAQPRHLVGVDIESRVHDVQALVRRTRLRERDGEVDAILVVLADTAHNRGLAEELRAALGDRFGTPPRRILAALRAGLVLPGSGVVLV